MRHPKLTVRSLRARTVRVPMRRPLGTSATRMTHAPFLLVDLATEEGVTGRAHAFCYRDVAMPMLRGIVTDIGELLAGEPVDPARFRETGSRRYRLVGTPGIVGMALSAIDVACWDALACAAELPLARYLGSERTNVPVYNSNGLSIGNPVSPTEEALELLEPGFTALKIRLGRDDASSDLDAVRAVRAAIPSDIVLMSDYNQALTVVEAIERGRSLDKEGLEWIEEPIAHDDLVGCAEVTAAIDTPVQIGENFTGPNQVATAARLGAMDFVMVDLMRIGGVSGWLEAAEIADQARMHLSSHLYPEVCSHLLAASATGHWLEYLDWAEPILEASLEIASGRAVVSDLPGTGVRWDEDAVTRYRFD